MPELLSPALIMVAAALAIGPARGHLRTAIVLLAPLLTLWAVWQVPDWPRPFSMPPELSVSASPETLSRCSCTGS